MNEKEDNKLQYALPPTKVEDMIAKAHARNTLKRLFGLLIKLEPEAISLKYYDHTKTLIFTTKKLEAIGKLDWTLHDFETDSTMYLWFKMTLAYLKEVECVSGEYDCTTI